MSDEDDNNFTVFFILQGCHKTHESIEYKGKVIREETRCDSPSGFSYIIHYVNDKSVTDSFMAVSLPSAFNVERTQIRFKINSGIPENKVTFCIQDFLPLTQKSIYDVKAQ